MWKNLFKGKQEKQGLVPIQKEFGMSEREKKQIEETQEWMEIGQLIERYRKKSDGGDFYPHKFKHNNIVYVLAWRRRSAMLELSGEIEGKIVKIAYVENNYNSKTSGIVFQLPISEEGQMKIKQMIKDVRNDLTLKIDEQKEKDHAKQVADVEKVQKEIQRKAQTLEKYL